MTSVTGLRLLVVDDEQAIARVLGLVLGEHHVTIAHSCHEARAALSLQEFDVILCDLSLPDGSGIEVYEFLRTLRPGQESRLGFLSGGGYDDRISAFLDEARVPELRKPFEISQVRAFVAEIAHTAGLPRLV